MIVWTMGKPLRHDGEVNVLEEELQLRNLQTQRLDQTTTVVAHNGQANNLVRNCVQITTVLCTMSALNGHDEPKLHLWIFHGLSRQKALSGPRHL